jgi:hypothetical protein
MGGKRLVIGELGGGGGIELDGGGGNRFGGDGGLEDARPRQADTEGERRRAGREVVSETRHVTYAASETRWDCAEAIANGDIIDGISASPIAHIFAIPSLFRTRFVPHARARRSGAPHALAMCRSCGSVRAIDSMRKIMAK